MVGHLLGPVEIGQITRFVGQFEPPVDDIQQISEIMCDIGGELCFRLAVPLIIVLVVVRESLAVMDAHFTTEKSYDGHIGLQVFRRNAEDLQALLADKMYSWSDLREACRDASTRPVIKRCEQNALKKAHNARIDSDIYNQRSMSETVFAMLKDDGDEIRSRSWHAQFRELTRKCVVHNLKQAAS